MTGGEQCALHSVRAQERGNILDLLAAAAPKTIGWLQVPLTPARQAAIAAFETRHRTSILPHLLDALDDIIFDTARPDRQPGGTDCRPDERSTGGAERAGKGFNMPTAAHTGAAEASATADISSARPSVRKDRSSEFGDERSIRGV